MYTDKAEFIGLSGYRHRVRVEFLLFFHFYFFNFGTEIFMEIPAITYVHSKIEM